MKRALQLSVVGIVGLAAQGAAAQVAAVQEFGQPGQVVVGAERMTGIYSDHLKSTRTLTAGGLTTNSEYKLNSTTIALLGTPMGIGAGDSSDVWPSSSPRFAVDVFVAPGLSIGGSFMYLTRFGYASTTAGNPPISSNQDSPTGSGVIFSPRVGYAAQLAPSFAIWPRAGVTYAYYRVTNKNTNVGGATTETVGTVDFTDVSIELMAVALPVPHVAVLFGPFLDLPLGGGSKTVVAGVEQPNPASLSYLSFGVTSGVAAYF